MHNKCTRTHSKLTMHNIKQENESNHVCTFERKKLMEFVNIRAYDQKSI